MEQKTKWRDKLILLGIQAAALIILLAIGAFFVLRPREKEPEVETTPPETTLATTAPTETVTEPTSPLPTNPYGRNDFQYYGDYLTCISGESIMGIDVSRYQGDIDWERVREAGVEFAIIRVGGRSYGDDGELYTDDNAYINYTGAKAAGIKVGVYFFAQAINVAEAREEAAFVLEQIEDWELDMPVVYDWEHVSSQARTADVGITTLTNCTREFCQTIEEAGYEAMIYFNPTHSDERVDLEQLMDYKFWLAMYSDRMTYPYKVDMWQYTCEGTIPGIEGYVDINLYFPYE